MRSLRRRLSLGLLVSLLALFLAQWLAVDGFVQRLSEGYVAGRLEQDADALLAALEWRAGEPAALKPARVTPVYQRPLSGRYYLVLSGDRRLRSRSLWDEDLPVEALAVGERRVGRLAGPRGGTLLVWAGGFAKGGRTFTIAVAEDLSELDGALRRFRSVYGAVTAAALVLLILFQSSIVAVTLRPLERVRRDLARLGRGEIEDLGEDVPLEVRPLVREVNRLLQLMSGRLRRSRNALGNLAHALKTPLMALTRLSDEPALRDDPELAERFARHTDTLRLLMERELKRARLSGPAAPGRRFDLKGGVDDLVGALHRIHADKDLRVESRVPAEAAYPGDREDMLELLGNLLDNAFKWAAGRIRVEAAVGDGLRLTVEDDGPGCSEADLARLATRGVRIDESVPGHGLGLAIARDVVEEYGGELRFGRSADLGGFRVEVRLKAEG